MFKRFMRVIAIAAALTFSLVAPAHAVEEAVCEESAGIVCENTEEVLVGDTDNGDDEGGEDPNDDAVVRGKGQPANPAPQAAPEVAVLGSQQLPVTGSETVALSAAGLVLLAAGGALVFRSRSAQAADVS